MKSLPNLPLKYYCDDSRHLICIPYSIENLHQMATILNLNKSWFHSGKFPHYDVPKRRIEEIQTKCEIVSKKEIINIINGALAQ